jgi:hypothetical protein
MSIVTLFEPVKLFVARERVSEDVANNVELACVTCVGDLECEIVRFTESETDRGRLSDAEVDGETLRVPLGPLVSDADSEEVGALERVSEKELVGLPRVTSEAELLALFDAVTEPDRPGCDGVTDCVSVSDGGLFVPVMVTICDVDCVPVTRSCEMVSVGDIVCDEVSAAVPELVAVRDTVGVLREGLSVRDGVSDKVPSSVTVVE